MAKLTVERKLPEVLLIQDFEFMNVDLQIGGQRHPVVDIVVTAMSPAQRQTALRLRLLPEHLNSFLANFHQAALRCTGTAPPTH